MTSMNRRAFVTGLGAILTAPLAAEAQQPMRIALLGSGTAQLSGIYVDALKQELHDNR
jgi:hypothetical protein